MKKHYLYDKANKILDKYSDILNQYEGCSMEKDFHKVAKILAEGKHSGASFGLLVKMIMELL